MQHWQTAAENASEESGPIRQQRVRGKSENRWGQGACRQQARCVEATAT